MGGSNWSELQPELLHAIRSRVLGNSVVDYIRFGAVCKSWGSVIVEKPRCLPPQIPLIMISSEPNIKTYSSFFYSHDSKNHYQPERERKSNSGRFTVGHDHGWMVALGHDHGWMITMGHNDLGLYSASLVNPITGDEILLPSLDGLIITYAMLSSHPTLTRDSENHCLVMALDKVKFFSQRLVLCKPGDDKWTVIENVKECEDLAYCNGILYCLSSRKRAVIVCDIATSSMVEQIGFPTPCEKHVRSHLIESFGEILLLRAYFGQPYASGDDRVVRFAVFRLDQSSRKWSEVKSIGDRTIFLSKLSKISLLASNHPGIKPNCILFLLGMKRYTVFSLEDNSTEEFPFDAILNDEDSRLRRKAVKKNITDGTTPAGTLGSGSPIASPQGNGTNMFKSVGVRSGRSLDVEAEMTNMDQGGLVFGTREEQRDNGGLQNPKNPSSSKKRRITMGGSKWSELLPELLLVIRSRVLKNSVDDYIRFGAVCKPWGSVIVEKPRCLPPQIPLIMKSSKTYSKTISSCFYSLESKSHYLRESKVGGYQNYRGYGHGWMVTEHYGDDGIIRVSLVNPITGEVLLPLPTELTIIHATLSSHPTLTRDSEDQFVVMALVGDNWDYARLAFCKPGDDNWTIIQGAEDCTDLSYCNGLLYCLNSCKKLVIVCDIGTSSVVTQIDLPESCGEYCHLYLRESSEELLLLKARMKNNRLVGFDVFRLDQSSSKWYEVKSLGDRTIFLSYLGSISLLASNHPGTKPNCIYFLPVHFKEYYGVFSLEDDGIENFPLDAKLYGEYSWQQIWFAPSLW
ncbi:hypothetical protein GIB67_026750 [Kingdonia uniflora]|uniref:KIB1-4 beta-propeller domain-containing protein n=1 Tax=Kingdonia uniflora TaxID=39325 RepID=A0A7J7MHQ0_9MAGN|nr:hypothetical protein GIB67_026750 [Kingdonia uniflora]